MASPVVGGILESSELFLVEIDKPPNLGILRRSNTEKCR